ncbi:Phytochrome, two-component sensor histidine kinase [hydrothermal vent metagenome]|uniref:histidine kinase n=1 Tax=hydrothermal vent metagenome TaxID=652676 RepID=A0A3B1AZ55_9ZZZZ
MNIEVYQQIISNAADGIITIDTHGLVHSFNPAAEKLFDYKADNIIGKNIRCLMGDEDKAQHDGYIRHYLETGKSGIIGKGLREVVAKRQDGSLFSAELTVSAMHLLDGQLMFIGMLRDISWRKQAEKDLRISEQRFELVTRGTNDGIWDWDLRTGNIYFSPRWKSMLGYNETEIDDNFMALQALIHPDDLGLALERWVACMEGETDAFVIEYRVRNKHNNYLYEDHDYLWIECRGLVQRDKQGNPIRLAGSHSDITNRKKAFNNLQKMASDLEHKAEALQRSNQELDQFAYVASHDLKAPLRAIANLSQWIEEDLDEVMGDDTRAQMTLLRGRVQRMEGLINGILQYSRVGCVNVDTQQVDVKQLLSEIIEELLLPSGCCITISPDMPCLQTARLPLSQVFSNLIDNAIRFHPKPELAKIAIAVKKLDDIMYEFSVTDDGTGIAPEYHEKIFQIFQTLNARDTVESTGVGLTIVKKIVEQLGGQIRLDSIEGSGSTFFFTLPVTRTTKNVDDSNNA